jgi:hypothetical protein
VISAMKQGETSKLYVPCEILEVSDLVTARVQSSVSVSRCRECQITPDGRLRPGFYSLALASELSSTAYLQPFLVPRYALADRVIIMKLRHFRVDQPPNTTWRVTNLAHRQCSRAAHRKSWSRKRTRVFSHTRSRHILLVCCS